MKFGCHLSIKGGYANAARRAYAIQATSFQYFPKNPRSLKIKQFDHKDAAACKQFCEENKLVSVSHSPYPTSLTPNNEAKRKQVVRSLLNDLITIAEACGSLGVVVHFGSLHHHLTVIENYQLIIEMLNDVLSEWEGNAKLLLENNAGLPGAFGTTLEELVQIQKLSTIPDKIGFCFDTCHAFASGLWTGENWDELLTKGLQLGYFEALEVIHLNNSKYAVHSGKDRHASIFGEGYIQASQFEQLIQTPQLKNIPFILETPQEKISHEQEIQLLIDKWG